MKAAVYQEHNKDPRKVVKIEDIEIPKITIIWKVSYYSTKIVISIFKILLKNDNN